jgi:VWFA-related protein
MQANPFPEGIIHLDVAATDPGGKPLSGLAVKDFTLLDNGVPQRIVSFAASNQPSNENERLTEVVLVLDEVNLSFLQLELFKSQLIQCLRQHGGHLGQPTSIYWSTNAGLYATAAPSTDGQALAEAVAHHSAPRTVWMVPRTHELFKTAESERRARWDHSLRALYTIAIERREKPGRKLLLWMGPGWPTVPAPQEHQSEIFPYLVELSTRIREARMVVSEVTARTEPNASSFQDNYQDYLAGVRTPAELEKPGQDPNSHFALPVLAIQSGGLVLDEPSAISRSIEHCIENERAFYTLSFDPPIAAHPDEYHDLKVQIDAPRLNARTNTGYYDQPVFYDQPRVPARRVSVEELEQILTKASGERDDELSKQLAGLELNERLSSHRLLLWKKSLHGKKSIAALIGLADESAFLDPPQAEILLDPAPDSDSQSKMLSRTFAYLKEVLPQLPDFFAIRTTVEYEQPSPQRADTAKTALADQSLHETETQQVTLRYRNGYEEQDAAKKTPGSTTGKKDFNLVGVFGPLLGFVLVDATHRDSIVLWSHWERGERGRVAVFRYIVRVAEPHYDVMYCCLAGGRTFLTSPRYLGELAIDPETGAILRLTMQAELGAIREPNLNPVRPADGAGIMVEYAPVSIGGKEYICPQRSVATMRVRTVSALTVWGQTFDIYGPYETRLNDSVYTGYHKFGAEARVLPGFDVAPNP